MLYICGQMPSSLRKHAALGIASAVSPKPIIQTFDGKNYGKMY